MPKLVGLPKGSPKVQEKLSASETSSRLLLSGRRIRLSRRRLIGRVLLSITICCTRRPGVVIVAASSTWKRYGGDCVFEDQLFLRSCFQNHRVLIKALDSSCQLDAAHQVDRDVAALFPGTVEKAVLYCVLLLCRFFHLCDSPRKGFRVI